MLFSVALNFQTPGQMMDVYEGRFRGNGACGYVLKPSVMREQISIFSANSKDTIPGVAPQILKIKVSDLIFKINSYAREKFLIVM